MERLVHTLEPIQRAGIAFYKYARKAGVYSSNPEKMDKVELIFRQLYQLKSFRNIIETSEPKDEEDRYLIFSPAARPEYSLCWVVRDNNSARVVYERFNSIWESKTYESTHYVIVDKNHVSMCFDDHAGVSFKTHNGHNVKPHT